MLRAETVRVLCRGHPTWAVPGGAPEERETKHQRLTSLPPPSSQGPTGVQQTGEQRERSPLLRSAAVGPWGGQRVVREGRMGTGPQ